jgi:UDP-N-acetylmuramoylalanine--D-glutamate ligase
MTDWRGREALVCGARVAGIPAAVRLQERGADVRIVDDRAPTGPGAERPDAAGLAVGPVPALVPPGVDLVVASPGFRPTHPLLESAAADGVEVIGEIELAWRLRGPGAAHWLLVTGTNGKTTTVHMVEAMLRAGGRRARAVGNVGESIVDAVSADEGLDVLAVEVSSQQLHFTSSVEALAAAVLNIAPDHLDWHGSMTAYVESKILAWRGAQTVIGGVDDRTLAMLLSCAPGRRVGVTLREPARGQLGLIDGALVDNAFDDDRIRLVDAAEVRPAGAHNIGNALAAAALVRAAGLPAEAVRDGLRSFRPDPHRNQLVASSGGVDYVDDSKATNPHAAAASLHGYPSVVWVAGGQLKGVDIEPLVVEIAGRLRAAVLLGADRDRIAAALARHAPDVPVVQVARTDDGAMPSVVQAAAELARPGDTVLLAPAAASYDMFTDYGQRGDRFAEAARQLER